MKAIILAAGRGSRMKGLTEAKPKCLIPVRGKTLLEWQLEALRKAGVEEIGIVTGYKRELLINYGLVEFNNLRWAETQMVSSLSCAEEWLNSEPCIVSYSDIFYEFSAPLSLLRSDADIAVTYDPNWLQIWGARFEDPLVDAESFKLRRDQSLSEIGQKPKSVEEVQGQYMGLLRFTPYGWSEVLRIRKQFSQLDADRMHMTGTLQKVIDEGIVPVHATPYFGQWGEVDSEEDLKVYS